MRAFWRFSVGDAATGANYPRPAPLVRNMMKHTLLTFSLTVAMTAVATAQSQDVGMTMDGGMLTVIYGQACGAVGCTPLTGGSIAGGESRNLQLFGAPQTFYALGIGNPSPCVAIPGIDNALLLQDITVLAAGLQSAPPLVPLPCQQGTAGYTLTMPNAVPAGITFRLQLIGVSGGGSLAFGPALEVTTV